MEFQFKWRSSVLNYRVYGSGNQAVLAFHGFDQNSTAFRFMEEDFGLTHRIISIDLPHQGKTIWNEPELNPNDLVLLIQDFKKSLEIQSTILLGYSLGANYTLGLVCADPASVQELWLVAGDGLSFRPLFRFVTGTVIGRYLFKGFVRFPGWVRFVLNLGSVTRILPERTARFFLSTIDSQPKRALLMQRWISAGRISPSPSTIIQTLNNHSIHCRMVYGEHDSLIPVRFARKFARKLNHVDLQLVPEGHMLLKSRYFKSFLTQPSLP
ncbi:MAG: alpha/beta hydrolase [Flavobacteriales bacterium]|nr:alpha/beta hydrolase [Bacteroidota bacterium]MCB9241326.1 alpha/beta hydrolase [Flavobacteriales bacterium]